MAQFEETDRDDNDPLPLYEAVWRQSQQMLETARQGEWDLLIALERSRVVNSSLLIKRESLSNYARGYREKVRELIQEILANDEEIRMLVEPRQRELLNIVGSLNTEKKLHKAYEMNV